MKTRMHVWISSILLLCIYAEKGLRTGYSQENSITKLMGTLKDDDRNVRAEAINALLALGPVAVDPLISALKNQNVIVRREAAAALGRTKDLRAVNPLIVALKDEDPIVGFRAAATLKDIRDPRAVEPLIAALKDKEAVVSYGAVEA